MTKEAIQLHTIADGEEATMFLYGAIGIQTEPDADSLITALTVRKALSEFVKGGAKKIHVRINSQGGLVGEAAAIVSAFNECTAEIHTYNDGRAYSAAADIWAAGKFRHMASNATMMIHYARGVAAGTPKPMSSYIQMLHKVSHATCQNIATAMNKTFDDVFKMFFEDEGDHFLTYAETKALNLLTETAETPQYEAASMSVDIYEAQKTLIEKLETQVLQMGNEVITITKKKEELEMDATALKSAIADGTMSLAEVEAIVNAEKAKQPLTAAAAEKLITEARAEDKAAIDALKIEVEALKKGTNGIAPHAAATTDLGAEAANDPDAEKVDLREQLNKDLAGKQFGGDDI